MLICIVKMNLHTRFCVYDLVFLAAVFVSLTWSESKSEHITILFNIVWGFDHLEKLLVICSWLFCNIISTWCYISICRPMSLSTKKKFMMITTSITISSLSVRLILNKYEFNFSSFWYMRSLLFVQESSWNPQVAEAQQSGKTLNTLPSRFVRIQVIVCIHIFK